MLTRRSWQGDQCVGNNGGVPRLGLRSMCMMDSPVGLRFTDYNSVFPSGQLTAATWDTALIYARGLGMGQEHRGKGSTVQLGPVVGPLGRSPEGGRNWEGFSPDPVLSGVAVAQTVQGVQAAGVIACTKHYIGNEQEHFRQAGGPVDDALSSNIDDKTMHELYLWPFADAVRAGTGAVMCSYNNVNNSYACQNSKILNGLLKDELNFQGFVMSDFAGQQSGVSSAVAGMDMSMPGDTNFNTGLSYWGPNLTLAVVNGTVPEYRVDDMAMRIMAAYFKVGRLVGPEEPPINFDVWTYNTFGPLHFAANDHEQQINFHVDVRANHKEVIREIGAAGAVLLKNNGILPLSKPKQIAVIGTDAGPNPNGANGCEDRGCNQGHLAMGWGSGTADYSYLVTPHDAIQARAIQDGSAYQALFLDAFGDDTDAQNANGQSDISSVITQDNTTAIVFVTSDSGEDYITVSGNQGDRNNLTLWNGGDALIESVAAINPNTIVVINSVGAVITEPWSSNPNVSAIIWAGLPGEQSGNALVDVLYGDVNPSGKTPFSWITDRSQLPDVLYTPNNGASSPQVNYTEGVFIDYRALDKNGVTPTWEFGFGLSYTTFQYSNLKVQKMHAPPYTPTKGKTIPAPTFGSFSTDLSTYLFPSNLTFVREYIYPYIRSLNASIASGDPDFGETGPEFLPPHAQDSTPQPLLAASGAPGGNPGLYDVLYTVTANIKNTGKVAGAEVVQMYVSLGGEDDPVVVLRGFDKLVLSPGKSDVFSAEITRRDISNWDVVSQDWVISSAPKTVFVGASSRQLHLSAPLN